MLWCQSWEFTPNQHHSCFPLREDGACSQTAEVSAVMSFLEVELSFRQYIFYPSNFRKKKKNLASQAKHQILCQFLQHSFILFFCTPTIVQAIDDDPLKITLEIIKEAEKILNTNNHYYLQEQLFANVKFMILGTE